MKKSKTQRGAAIIMALSFFAIASFVVMQLSRETLTESTLANQSLKRLKAYYSAKAGLELALLRVKAYQEAKAALDNLGSSVPQEAKQKLSIIWQFPLPWPLPLPEDASLIAKGENEKLLTKSLLKKINFFHQIEDTGSKIDLNSLGSPVERIQKRSLESLLRSFEKKLETDEELAAEHSIDSIKEVLHNVADWVDPNKSSLNGGDESSYYTKESQEGYPRNQSFMNVSELMLVHDMDDLIYKHLKNLVSLYAGFGINVNTADADTLMGISENFTEQSVQEFISRRDELKRLGQELDKNSFDNLLLDLGFRDIAEIHSQGVPILFSPLSAFKITSSGTSGEIESLITAYVIDSESLKEIFIDQLDKQSAEAKSASTPSANPSKSTNPPQKSTKKKKAPEGKPYIVHMEVD